MYEESRAQICESLLSLLLQKYSTSTRLAPANSASHDHGDWPEDVQDVHDHRSFSETQESLVDRVTCGPKQRVLIIDHHDGNRSGSGDRYTKDRKISILAFADVQEDVLEGWDFSIIESLTAR